jgi:hypothetical protein
LRPDDNIRTEIEGPQGGTTVGREAKRFRVTLVLPVPLSFAYKWCTDYTPDDGKYAGEDRSIGLVRRIVRRNRRRVIFENLYNVGKGWGWERHTVTLAPPDRWHSDGIGAFFESHLDYRLRELPGNRTRFEMTWSSRPMPWYRGPRGSRRAVEAFVTMLWERRARAMRREYSAAQGGRSNAERGGFAVSGRVRGP